jgi:hypothetical protein
MEKITKTIIIQGPVIPSITGGVLYEVTLASGIIITNPINFGQSERTYLSSNDIITEKGEVLASRYR